MSPRDQKALLAAWQERDDAILVALAGTIVGAALAVTGPVEVALGCFLPGSACWVYVAVAAHRRADSILSRSLAAHLAEHGTEQLAEAA